MATSNGKIVTEKDLKKSYENFQNDLVHKNCSCPSCLFHFVKSKNKRIRIEKDSFFLYWLAHVHSYSKNRQNSKFFSHNKNRVHKWEDILKLYERITGQKWKTNHMQKEREHFRIISRYDKRFNLSGIINARDNARILAPIEISWFMFELENMFEIIRRYPKNNFRPAWSLSPENLEWAFYKIFRPILKYSFKIFDYLSKENREVGQRDISRKIHIKRDDLILYLSYLEFRKLIAWNKKNRKISLNPDWIFWFKRFDRDMHLIFEGIKKMAPYSIFEAKENFDKMTSWAA